MRTTVNITASLVLAAVAASYPVTATGAPADRCRGVPATIVGTDSDNTIHGTNGRDVVVAKKGEDYIAGRGGNDLVCAGPGADILRGGLGDDSLHGDADGFLFGEDQYGDDLAGGPGNDVLDGGPGLSSRDRGQDELSYPKAKSGLLVDLAAHTARVGAQRDTVYSIEYVQGTRFADTLRGDEFFQFFSSLQGDDLLIGRAGVDFLFAAAGDDEVHGDEGNDVLDGGLGFDVAFGGSNGQDGDDCRRFEEEQGCER